MPTVKFPLFSVQITREEIPLDVVHEIKVPDEQWRHVDKKGHLHAWVKGKTPTLKWVVTGKRWVGDEYDGEEVDVGEYRCRVCAEPIVPRMKSEPGPSFVPGPTTVEVTINGETFRLTEGEYTASVESWRDSLIEITRRAR